MRTREEALDESMKIVKDSASNEDIKKLVDALNNDNDKNISDELLKMMGHYALNAYGCEKEKVIKK